MLGTGSTAASSLLAGNVFLATANPATLMTIGTGVGSAVMGPAGIVGQAPFVAASRALMPVVAPVMLFTTVSSLMICARLDRAQRTLGQLSAVVERVRRLLDAEDYARFETAAERIDEIRSEFKDCRRFASDVPERISRIEHDVSLLRSKYGLLVTHQVQSEEDAKSAVSDLGRFFLASLQDIQIDVLQLYLALQNDPDVVESRQSRLREKIERYGEDFRQVIDDDPVGAYHRKLKGDLAESTRARLPRHLRLPRRFRLLRGPLPHPLRRGLAAKARNAKAIRRQSNSVQTRMERWIDATATDDARPPSVIFYRQPDGDRTLRAYHTHDVRLEGTST
ncbi:MAG: hypothetical protein F4X22_02790 [Gemmatimonadales bacterium]|nr:hypothetical protein [Candidatus Palauibacter denitrificans]